MSLVFDFIPGCMAPVVSVFADLIAQNLMRTWKQRRRTTRARYHTSADETWRRLQV